MLQSFIFVSPSMVYKRLKKCICLKLGVYIYIFNYMYLFIYLSICGLQLDRWNAKDTALESGTRHNITC